MVQKRKQKKNGNAIYYFLEEFQNLKNGGESNQILRNSEQISHLVFQILEFSKRNKALYKFPKSTHVIDPFTLDVNLTIFKIFIEQSLRVYDL